MEKRLSIHTFGLIFDLYKQATQEAAKALEDKLPDLKDEIEEKLAGIP